MLGGADAVEKWAHFPPGDSSIMVEQPSLELNRWVSGVIRMYRPQIEDLLRSPDAAVAQHQANHPEREVFEDRALQVTSEMPVDFLAQVRAIEAATARSARPGIQGNMKGFALSLRVPGALALLAPGNDQENRSAESSASYQVTIRAAAPFRAAPAGAAACGFASAQ